jgi:sucrose-6-phosphate hydrolase SacC (GH32 family)
MIRFTNTLLFFCIVFTGTAQIQPAPYQTGGLLKDNEGHIVNAHGLGVLYYQGIYYLYGEVKKGKTRLVPNQDWEDYRVPAGGISCYSSRDLIHWKNEGMALASTTDNKDSDLDTGRVIERPKVIYNRHTGKFVMWMHIDKNDYSYAAAGVAVSDKPEGPFQYLGSGRPNNQMSRDMTVFQDGDKAYLVYASENNMTMQICLLSDDYLAVTAKFKRILVNAHREAPAMFTYRNKYYLITSLCTGWDANAASYAIADSVMGEWKQEGNPCTGKDSATTFHSQGTFVLPIGAGQNDFLFMADRWNKSDLPGSGYLWIPLHIENGSVQIKMPLTR